MTVSTVSEPVRSAHRFLISMALFLIFTALVVVSNVLAAKAGGNEESPLMMVSGILLGFITIPVICIGIPLWLARKWNLPRSWWPAREHLGLSVLIVTLFIILGNYIGFELLIESGFDPVRFLIHFISSMLFHVPYYALFTILIFATARAWKGTVFAFFITALLFSLYHIAHFHFFPAGTEPLFLGLLFVSYLWNLLLYVMTRSILLVAFQHSVGGAVAMAAKGTYHDGLDFLFFLTILIVGGMVVYSLFDQRRVRRDELADGLPVIRIPRSSSS